MPGADDVPLIEPFEYLSIDGLRYAQWRCPRCEGTNRTLLRHTGACPSICRACFGSVSLYNPPPGLTDTLPTAWITVLSDGTTIRVQADEGGHRFEVRQAERAFGAYDSGWSRQAAYDAAQRMIKVRRRRPGE